MIAIVKDVLVLLAKLPPEALTAVYDIIKAVASHEDPRIATRHALVLAAKAKLGLK